MAAEEHAILIDQDWRQKAKILDTFGEFLDLLPVVFARVVWVGADCRELDELKMST
jgi:hypothetical protein